MDMETIEKTAKSARTRARRTMNGVRKNATAQAERTGADVVVAIDRAQRSVSEFGDRAYSTGRDAVTRVANEIEARPLAAAALMGGAILAGLSCYMLLTSRRR